MHLPMWWTWWYLWSFFKFIAPVVVSLIALWIVLKDRRAQLVLKDRKGKWFTLYESLDRTETVFQGIVEVYNVSARANVIRSYSFLYETSDGTWREMEWEPYKTDPDSGGNTMLHNDTPLTLAPYSGTGVNVEAFAKIPRPKQMRVRIEIEDVFEKRHSIVVTATRN